MSWFASESLSFSASVQTLWQFHGFWSSLEKQAYAKKRMRILLSFLYWYFTQLIQNEHTRLECGSAAECFPGMHEAMV